MALVDGRVRAQEIEILFALDVPDVHTLTSVQNYRQGVVIVRAVRILHFHRLRGTLRDGQLHALKIR